MKLIVLITDLKENRFSLMEMGFPSYEISFKDLGGGWKGRWVFEAMRIKLKNDKTIEIDRWFNPVLVDMAETSYESAILWL